MHQRIREIVKNLIQEEYLKGISLNESGSDSSDLVDGILDRINRNGMQSLSFDEKEYLSQYNSNSVDGRLEDWLLSDDDSTFDNNGEKLPYDEFVNGEDIFGNWEKLYRVISKHLGERPLTGNAEWAGGYAWPMDYYGGIFLYLGDDELVVLERMADEEGNNQDRVVKYIVDSKGFYQTILNYKKGKKF